MFDRYYCIKTENIATFRVSSYTILFRLSTEVSRTQFPRTMLVLGPGSTRAGRITETTATTIDHVYSSHPENITECFISHFTINDHFPVCFTRKTNFKVIKNDHLTTSYRCFMKFDDILFLNDLQNDLNSFSANSSDVEEDFST